MARVIPVDIGCQPSPSGSGELILVGETATVVVFAAIDTKLSERGCLEDKGTAIVECVDCCQTRQGHPNDDGRQEHPLWHNGLSEVGGISEVEDSNWMAEVDARNEQTKLRLWGETTREIPKREVKLKHFIFTFKESTFECLATRLSVSLHKESYETVARKALSLVLHEPAT